MLGYVDKLLVMFQFACVVLLVIGRVLNLKVLIPCILLFVGSQVALGFGQLTFSNSRVCASLTLSLSMYCL